MHCADGGVTPIDIDNDGWIDLAAIVETRAGPQVRVFRNKGDGSFEDVSHALGLDAVKFAAPRGLISRRRKWRAEPDCDPVERAAGAAAQCGRQ